MAQNWNLPPAGTDFMSVALKLTFPDALESLRTLHSGSAEPASKVAYMLWADTTTAYLKQRNSGNSAWLKLWPLAGGVKETVGPTLWGTVNATRTEWVGRVPRAGTILRLVLHSSAASTSSSGNEVQFTLKNYPNSAPGSPVNLFSGTVGTFTALGGVGGGAEFVANKAYVLTPNQNSVVAADDLQELVVTYVGAPTATLTRFMASVEME